MLKAVQSTGDKLENTHSIWESQIDPMLGLNASPFFYSADGNNRLTPPSSPWNFSTTSFMAPDGLFMPNGLGHSLNVDSYAPMTNSYHLLESPFYDFPDTFATANGSCSLPSYPLSCVPNSSTPNLPTKQPKPVALFPTTIAKDSSSPIAHTNSSANKKKICLYCGKKCSKKGNLEAHIRIHTKEKPFACTYCDKRFSQQSSLKRHIRIHTKEKPFVCAYCSKKFTHQSNFKRHLATHTLEKPYQCTHCAKTFTRQGNLTRHLATHTKEKAFQCTYCSKSFAQKGNLKRHIRTHTKEKKFICTYCDKAFVNQSNLKRHIRIHTKEKPYQCVHCQKRFTQHSSLKKHIKSQHN